MQRSNEFANVPVIILCGGKGVILDETQCQRTNKALIRVRGKPLLYWVMRTYALHGATEFILAAGFQTESFGPALLAAGAEAIGGVAGRYSLRLGTMLCHIKLVTTPTDFSTGARLLACRTALADLGERECFAVTYSDTLSDLDLAAEMRFHKKHRLIATMVAAKLPVRFRVLGIRTREVLVRGFAARPVIEAASVNGGYYLFNPTFWQVASSLSTEVALENQPLEQIAAAGQLAAFEHKGAWQTCDAERDIIELDRLARLLSDFTTGLKEANGAARA
jgi:glucose-1-phosphate cytidylyltransferase